jgi:transcriptional regulator GlxA family with amidase domain
MTIYHSTMFVAEEALRSATTAGKQETGEASGAFEVAKERLLQYRATVHPG